MIVIIRDQLNDLKLDALVSLLSIIAAQQTRRVIFSFAFSNQLAEEHSLSVQSCEISRKRVPCRQIWCLDALQN